MPDTTLPAATANAPSDADLTLIPMELQIQIAELIEAHDLLALRRTCRALADATHDLFVVSFFTKRTHSYDPEGLQTLADITTAVGFVSKIKEIRIAVHHIPLRETVRLALHSLVSQSAGSEATLRLHKEILLVFAQEQCYIDVLKPTLDALLVQVLKNLVLAHTIPDLTVTVYNPRTDAYGIEPLRMGPVNLTAPAIVTEFYLNNAVRGMLTAIVSTGFPCRVLDLCAGRRNLHYCHGRYAFELDCRPHALSLSAPAPFANLTTLRLRFRMLGYLRRPMCSFQGEDTGWPTELFSSMSALKHLALEGSAWDVQTAGLEDQGIHEFLGVFSAPHLTTLELCGINASRSDLLTGLDCFKASLKHLKLKTCILPVTDGVDHWLPIIDFIGKNLSLELVTLQGLRISGCLCGQHGRNRTLTYRGRPVNTVFKGADRIKETFVRPA